MKIHEIIAAPKKSKVPKKSKGTEEEENSFVTEGVLKE